MQVRTLPCLADLADAAAPLSTASQPQIEPPAASTQPAPCNADAGDAAQPSTAHQAHTLAVGSVAPVLAPATTVASLPAAKPIPRAASCPIPASTSAPSHAIAPVRAHAINNAASCSEAPGTSNSQQPDSTAPTQLACHNPCRPATDAAASTAAAPAASHPQPSGSAFPVSAQASISSAVTTRARPPPAAKQPPQPQAQVQIHVSPFQDAAGVEEMEETVPIVVSRLAARALQGRQSIAPGALPKVRYGSIQSNNNLQAYRDPCSSSMARR